MWRLRAGHDTAAWQGLCIAPRAELQGPTDVQPPCLNFTDLVAETHLNAASWTLGSRHSSAPCTEQRARISALAFPRYLAEPCGCLPARVASRFLIRYLALCRGRARQGQILTCWMRKLRWPEAFPGYLAELCSRLPCPSGQCAVDQRSGAVQEESKVGLGHGSVECKLM